MDHWHEHSYPQKPRRAVVIVQLGRRCLREIMARTAAVGTLMLRKRSVSLPICHEAVLDYA